jgi:hypothetical protein
MDLRATPNLVHLRDSSDRSGGGRRSLQLTVAKGYRIVAVSGEVWVTQSGFIEDYVLRRGDAVTLVSEGPAVVTSFGPADVEVIAPPSAPQGAPTISLDAIERAQHEAHRLRAQAMQEMFGAAWAALAGLGRRLARAFAAAPHESRTRQPC